MPLLCPHNQQEQDRRTMGSGNHGAKTSQVGFCWILSLFFLLIRTGVSYADEQMDAVAGSAVVLECRFDPRLLDRSASSTFYWIRSNRRNHDNVAIGETAFHQDYRVYHVTSEGRYDLHISNSNYERDNGRFECRIKEDGTGTELFTHTVGLTVLLPPNNPEITRLTGEVAVEGQSYTLACSTQGGSPPPDITWYRAGDSEELPANVTKAKDKDSESISVVELTPARDDDGAEFRCEVYNRAMGPSERHTATTNISVNYFPVVTVGPENPYRVEVDHTAEMHCTVDSKPRIDSVRWEFSSRFIDTNFRHVIPQVSLQDAGSYYCTGDNGLGQEDKEELLLDVQYGPQIIVSGANDVDIGDTILLNCQVSANPRPLGVQWLRKGSPKFLQQGQTLRILNAEAKDSGEYVCNSYNFIHPSGRERKRREKNSTIIVNVRHKPGQASILPKEAIAVAGRAVTLVCHAEPPGYPEPSYRWWREGKDSSILATSSHYTIENVEVGSAGRYFCQPHNSLGHVKPASVDLQVYLTPKLTSFPPAQLVKREGDSNLQISCSSTAKPKPSVRWFKDGIEVVGSATDHFQVSSSEQGQNILSTLSFIGPIRINSNQLSQNDKGHYSCQFENQVGRSEHTVMLRIEHKPVPVNTLSKVAFDIKDKGQILCRMRGYPEPRFDWTFGDSVVELDVANYYSNVTQLDFDLFESVLTITKVRASSYGEYTCRALNSMGYNMTKVMMQRKGPPEPPSGLSTLEVTSNSASIVLTPGFNGGFKDTEYVIEWKQDNTDLIDMGKCQTDTVCNISDLSHHSTYSVRVKATNTVGESAWSPSLTLSTLIDLLNIPRPDSLVLELSTSTAHVKAPPTELLLVAELELLHNSQWIPYSQHKLSYHTYGQVPVSYGETASPYSQLPITGQQEALDPPTIPNQPVVPNGIRARLCLEDDMFACGPYLEGTMVQELDLGQPWLIALIVVVTLLGLVAILIAVKCICQTRKNRGGGKNVLGKAMSGRGSRKMPGTRHLQSHQEVGDTYKSNMFSIAGENQHGISHYDINQQIEQGSSNSQADSANSQEPLWAYQQSPVSDGMTRFQEPSVSNQDQHHYPSHALAGYDNPGPPSYPFIDDTPTDPNRNYFAYHEQGGRPISGQYNCATGMGESQYSYQGLPDPSAYFNTPDYSDEGPEGGTDGVINDMVDSGQPNIFICDNSLMNSEGLQTPNTRARRVVHEVIV